MKMAAIPRTHEDIEAQIKEIQSRKKEIVEDGLTEKERVGLGESGFYDRDIYDGGGKFEGYVTSIAANDEIEDEEYDVVSFSQNKRPGYTAPVALLNDVAQSETDYDPFADRRRQTIAEKEDEYRQKRRRMIISPERIDPFADGRKNFI
uniref:Splicing factor 3B subunit 1 domain-containing protein n=1 Tax=Clastoptera arizonana TaxID=38151 RepID=A0A1B6CJ24_9HEMI